MTKSRKNFDGHITAFSTSNKAVPTVNECGFICTGTVSRDIWRTRKLREQSEQALKNGIAINTISAIGAAVTIGLGKLATKKQSQKLNAATALLGFATAFGTIAAHHANLKNDEKMCARISDEATFMPEMVATYERVSADAAAYDAKIRDWLHYNPSTDGMCDIIELKSRRERQMYELLDKAGMNIDMAKIVELFDEEDMRTIQELYGAANRIIALKEEKEAREAEDKKAAEAEEKKAAEARAKAEKKDHK